MKKKEKGEDKGKERSSVLPGSPPYYPRFPYLIRLYLRGNGNHLLICCLLTNEPDHDRK